jgi:2'-deoxynucleoside 5'-phosphate N-hydrolase
MKVYFAGSIRGGREDRQKYLDLIEFTSTLSEVLTEHIGSPSIGNHGESALDDLTIYQRDMEWLESADALIAEVTTASLGVGYELGVAEKLDKPILCLFDESKNNHRLSAMITGNSNLLTFRYQSLTQAREKIKEFLSSVF